MRCYVYQTYPRRELVILVHGVARYRQAVELFVRSLGRSDIRVVALDTVAFPAAGAAGWALDALVGDVVCAWADGDLSAPERLEYQLNHLVTSGADGCVFTDRLHFFPETRELFWVEAKSLEDPPDAFLGTLMAYRSACTPAVAPDVDLVGPVSANPGARLTSMDHAGPLTVRVFDDGVPDWSRWREDSESASYEAAFVDAHLASVQAVLPHYRLPRPLLIAARGQELESVDVTWRSP